VALALKRRLTPGEQENLDIARGDCFHSYGYSAGIALRAGRPCAGGGFDHIMFAEATTDFL
jgi:hypothetical protein